MIRRIITAVSLCFMFSTGVFAADQPNVLFITVDDLNNDLGCYGHGMVKSPHIDGLAKRGMRFERAYCQYPVCNPSRASFMTGLYPQQTGVLSNAGNFRKNLAEVVTLPQLFQKHGYFAARIGKIYHYGVPTQIGTDGVDDPDSWNEVVNPRGRDKDDEPLIKSINPNSRSFGGTLSWLAAAGEDDEQTDAIGAKACIELMEQHHPDKTGKPFFLAMGFYRPHTPFVAPKKYFEMYPREKIELVKDPANDRDDIPPAALADRRGQLQMSDDVKREVIQSYYASITFMDAQVGRLIEALERLKLADNTIIVFVSDHGYHMGRHGLWQKGDLFEGSARVPLIIVDPRMRVSAGKSADAIVELVDLYTTLTDLCGLNFPRHTMGRSLKPNLEDPTAFGRSAAYTVSHARGSFAGKPSPAPLGYTVRTKRYRYTEWGDAAQFGVELYDYEADPHEHTNLAGKASHAGVQAKLKVLLADRKGEAMKEADVSAAPPANAQATRMLLEVTGAALRHRQDPSNPKPDVDMARRAIELGADVHWRESNQGATLLHYLANAGETALAAVLIEGGAAVNAYTRDGRTALYEAAGKGHLDTVKLLLQNGAAADAADPTAP